MILDDTQPQARAVQTSLLRQFSSARRFAMVNELTHATISWSRRTVRESMPGASEHEVLLRWIEFTYGPALAARLRSLHLHLGD